MAGPNLDPTPVKTRVGSAATTSIPLCRILPFVRYSTAKQELWAYPISLPK
jgi:hypothetical protein